MNKRKKKKKKKEKGKRKKQPVCCNIPHAAMTRDKKRKYPRE
jgi:hypothetical protein